MMSRKQVAELMDRMVTEEHEVREQGNREYAHDDSNALANFERLAATLNLSREQVLLVYLYKHLDGITSWVGGHRSQREDIRGRIKDARVYLLLLRAMVEDSESKPTTEVLARQITDMSRVLGGESPLRNPGSAGLREK